MAKLHGKAKAAFLARMAKGRKHGKKPSRPSFKASTHHGPPHRIARSAVRREASALKHIADKAASDMKRMAAQCKADIKKAKAQATRAAKKTGPKKKRHGKKRKSHAKKKHHAHKTHKHHAKKTHRKARKHHKHEKSVSASKILGGGKKGKGKGMQTWVCSAPVRTGCGGGARGGHVLGDRSRNTAVRYR